MPKLTDHENVQVVRGLLVGDSGSGKTGALASLVEDGYRLWIADYDNGIDVLANILRRRERELGRKLLDRVDYRSIRSKYTVVGSRTVPENAEAWGQGLTYLQSAFKNDPGPEDVLVLDSISFAAKFAMHHILKINNRLQVQPWQSDYGEAQGLIENLVGMLTDDDVGCNVLCTAHIAWTELENDPNGAVRGLPALIGKALNPVIPRYFNHVLACRSVGDAESLQRYIHTQPVAGLELKNAAPGSVRPRYPLESGLAQYFADVLGVRPEAKEAA